MGGPPDPSALPDPVVPPDPPNLPDPPAHGPTTPPESLAAAGAEAPPETPAKPDIQPEPPRAAVCGNCGTGLLGPHCFRCGQPTQGLVRHFGSIMGDFVDSVFNLDSRTLQTLGPLFFKPGFLTREYFAGRRVRYVTPVRMFVFLTLIAFFVSNLSLDIDAGDAVVVDDDTVSVGTVPVGPTRMDVEPSKPRARDVDNGRATSAAKPGPAASKRSQRRSRDYDLARTKTVAEAEAARDRALADLAKARAETADVPGVGVGLKAAEADVRLQAEQRLEWLRARDIAIRDGKPVPPEPRRRAGGVSFGGWDPHKTPANLPWLPDFANAALTDWGRRAFDNGERIRDNPRLLAEAFFSVAPQTLFVLLPLFALLLKILYVFKRRLYMEHLIVALHSHAFIALWLILILGAYALGETLAAGAPRTFLNFAIAALWIWMPVHLLLMQKRVYAQGWIMTLLKFFVLGIAYLILLSFGATAALVLSLVLM